MELFLRNVVSGISFTDILDILIVTIIIYKVLDFIRETRAEQLAKGILLLVVATLLSKVLQLYTLHWILSGVMTVGLIAVVVIFQPELRRGLEYLGRSKFSNVLSEVDKEEAKYMVGQLVEAVDSISMPGIVEVVAVEYFSNKDEDDIENGLVGGLVPIPSDPNDKTTEDDLIIGETFIKPKLDYKYQFVGNAYGDWYIENKYPIDMKICEEDNSVTLKWRSGYSGQFDLYYGYDNADLYIAKRTIVVQSLF